MTPFGATVGCGARTFVGAGFGVGAVVGMEVGVVCFPASVGAFTVGAAVGLVIGGGFVGTVVGGVLAATGLAVCVPDVATTELQIHNAKRSRNVLHPNPSFVFFGNCWKRWRRVSFGGSGGGGRNWPGCQEFDGGC